jgi:hypothetical protein
VATVLLEEERLDLLLHATRVVDGRIFVRPEIVASRTPARSAPLDVRLAPINAR